MLCYVIIRQQNRALSGI